MKRTTPGVPVLKFHADPLARLTDRELEVLELIAQGLSNEEIRALLFLSMPTVKTHVRRIVGKLGGLSRPQLVVLAYETGLVTPRRWAQAG